MSIALAAKLSPKLIVELVIRGRYSGCTSGEANTLK
jgi:hypothetical protein